MPFVLANIFQPLVDAFDWLIVSFHDSIGLSWGLSIIALTVVVRLGLLPLTIKQFKSMAAMQRLAPQIKELQAKYKDDKQRLNRR
jgi:YidC/Oxa1 family membrane protein insertase